MMGMFITKRDKIIKDRARWIYLWGEWYPYWSKFLKNGFYENLVDQFIYGLGSFW